MRRMVISEEPLSSYIKAAVWKHVACGMWKVTTSDMDPDPLGLPLWEIFWIRIL